MFKKLSKLVFVLALLFSNTAVAQMDITVGNVQRYFLEGKKPFQTLVVKNHNATKTFEIGAKIDLYKNVGETKATAAELEEVSGHFMLAPRRFVLKPGESRSVRLVYTQPFGDKEQVYRLVFQPRHVNQKAFNNTEATAVKPSVSFVTAAGMLILASPKNPELNLAFERDETGITFKNEGNIAADLRLTRKYCYTLNSEETCIGLPGKRVYPGNTWRFEIDPQIPLRWAAMAYNELRQWLEIPAYSE